MKDLYIASCAENGGIYHFKTNENADITFCEKTDFDRPMYMTADNNKMYILLRAPFENSNESGLITCDIDENGKLVNPSNTVSTKGVVACHIMAENNDIYAVNYLSGNVIKFPDTVDTHSGKGINPSRQDMPHTHFVGITPDKKFVCVTDLGTDSIYFYDRNLDFKFKVRVPDGHGARHLAFSDNGKIMYCVNELASSVSVFRYDGENTKLLNTYPALPDGFDGNNLAAAIRIKDGYLYVSNRGHNSIAVFKIQGDDLILKRFAPVGSDPRDFNIYDDILVSADMSDNKITFYKINDGNLSKLNTEIENITEPLCVIFRSL